jgi:hypothetical protein
VELARLVAHQGGWDEILLVAAPLVLIAGVLWLANRRAQEFARREEEREAAAAPAGVEPDEPAG